MRRIGRWDGTADVYICLVGQTVIYVGYTTSGFSSRWANHKCTSEWAQLVSQTIVMTCKSEDEARTTERVLIRNLRPLMNVQGNPDFDGTTKAQRAQMLDDRLTDAYGLSCDADMAGAYDPAA